MYKLCMQLSDGSWISMAHWYGKQEWKDDGWRKRHGAEHAKRLARKKYPGVVFEVFRPY